MEALLTQLREVFNRSALKTKCYQIQALAHLDRLIANLKLKRQDLGNWKEEEALVPIDDIDQLLCSQPP